MHYRFYVWRYVREILYGLRAIRGVKKGTARTELPSVRVIRADGPERYNALVEFYARNPSPFLGAPKTRRQLETRLRKGVQFFLSYTDEGEVVCASGFWPEKAMLTHVCTDYRFRGQGYLLASASQIIDILASAGFKEVNSNARSSNKPLLRVAERQGWKVRPHPINKRLVRLTLQINAEKS